MDLRAMKLAMLKRILCPAEVCVGKGSVERLGCLDPARVLVVIGASARASGALDRVTSQLKGASAREILNLPAGEPQAATVEAARASVRTFEPEWIVALGGGAVMDTAKFVWAEYEQPELVLSGATPHAIGPLRQKARMIAVPTTAGSGSEASQASLLSREDGTKVAYVSPHWVPDLVILDPTMTVTLPREVTVAGGFDALTHAVEAAVSSLANSMLRALAATAIGLVMRHLPVAAENPQDLLAREGMQEAAFLAGLCQSTASTGAAHALSHATSKLHGASHGAATAFYLLPTMRWNRARNPTVYDELARAYGLVNGAALEVAIAAMATRLEVPEKYAELVGRALDASELQALAETAAKDVCLRTNACRLSAADLAQLLAGIG